MEKKFQDGNTQQPETRISHGPGFLTDADDQEQQRKQSPGDAVAHIAREVSGKFKRERVHARATEVIRDLNV